MLDFYVTQLIVLKKLSIKHLCHGAGDLIDFIKI